MEENKENIQNETEKDKDNGKIPTRFKILVLAFLLFLGGIWAWNRRYRFFDPTISPKPTLEAITQEQFEELPVGLIYKMSQEEKDQYYALAKQKYEQYKDLGPQQVDSGYMYNPENYAAKRMDATERPNTCPSDMLNEDSSLRYPDMFYGFIIHDESITGKTSKAIAGSRKGPFDYWNEKANQILFVEDYYLNGGKTSKNAGTFEWEYIGNANSEGQGMLPESKLINKAYKSGFMQLDSSNIIRSIFNSMAIPTSYTLDAYDTAKTIVAIDLSDYFHEADGLLEELPEKYNDVANWPNSNPVYYFPTKIWKVDNNTIMVDIQIEGGDRMTGDDMFEMMAKINQSNIGEGEKEGNGRVKYTDDKYIVFARFFNSDITQGMIPDFGIQTVNYNAIGSWMNGLQSTADHGTFVFNNQAKDILRDIYKEFKTILDAGQTPSTRNVVQEVANKHGVSYVDALNIYVSHYCLSTDQCTTAVQW